MNEIKIFENPEFGSIRTTVIDGEPWFVGKDVIKVLGYENISDTIKKHIDDEDKIRGSQNATPSIKDSLGRTQYPTWINESGLYSLILSSKLESAKKFKHWVTSEVLPSIRKHGAYATENTIDKILGDPDFGIRVLQELKAEKERNKTLTENNKLLTVDVERMRPKEIFADAVEASDTSILVGDMAKLIKQNGIDIGQKRLFSWLRENGYLIKREGSDWNMPTQKSMDHGLFEVKERAINNPDGSVRITRTSKITGKGQQFFINKFLGKA